MYQRTYTTKTDVWSAAVTLYVLVAGYPVDQLQKAFNLLQTNGRDLRKLPNIPNDLPDSFFEMMDGLLLYKHKQRKSAGDMLDHEFVQFHRSVFSVENVMLEAANATKKPGTSSQTLRRTQSVALRGSVGRHTLFIDYQKHQRSFTTILATMLTKKELSALVESVHQRLAKERNEKVGTDNNGEEKSTLDQSLPDAERKALDIIKIKGVKELLVEAGHQDV
jgi:serine/threonine protein kinase